MADDIQNLILNVMGRDDVERLTQAIKLEEEMLRIAIETTGKHSAATAAQAQVVVNYQKQLEAAQDVIKTTTTHTKNYQQASLAASYALQDFTSAGGGLAQALAGVNNNIPQIVMGLGGSAGLTAGIGALSTVVMLGVPHLMRYVDSLHLFSEATTGAKDGIDVLKDRIKELQKTPLTLAVDASELDAAREKLKQLEAAQRAYEAGQAGKSLFEAAAGKQAKEAFETYGDEYAQAQRKMVDIKAGEMTGRDPVIRMADQAKARAERIMANIDQQLTEIQDAEGRTALLMSRELQEKAIAEAENRKALAVLAARKNAELAIGGLRAGVEAGNQPAARADLAGRLRQVGAEGLAGAVEQATPQEAEAKAKEQIFIEDQRRMARLNKDLAAKAQKAANEVAEINKKNLALVDMLNAQGLENQRLTFADRDKGKAAGVKGAAEQVKRQVEAQIKAEDVSIKASGAGLMAESLLAKATAARGEGVAGFKGKSDDQIFSMVQREVEKYLHRQIGVNRFGQPVRANAGMGRGETSDLATRITAGSKTDLDKRLLGMSGQNVSNTSKLLGVASQLDGEVNRLTGVVQAQGRAIDQLAGRARARARTAQKR